MPAPQNRNSDRKRRLPVASPTDAVLAIEMAFGTIDPQAATADQRADLADAIDAYAERSYYVAKALAEASLRKKRALEARSSDTRTLDELRLAFHAARRDQGHLPFGDER